MIKPNLKLFLFIFFYCIFLSACTTTSSKKSASDWPSDVPQKAIFMDAYEKQVAEGTNDSSLKAHLVWVKRFYRGTVLYPIGWNNMTEMVMESLTDSSPKEQDEIRKRLGLLGEKICIEWTQANRARNIDSSNIITWANAMRTSVKQDSVFSFIEKVESDVDQLVSHTIDKGVINRNRYYPPENFDDF